MKLSTLAIAIGLSTAGLQIFGILFPAECRTALRKLPRSLPWGIVFTLAATAGFLWNLQQEAISDFAVYKPMMLAGFGLLGVATCIFVQDFLAVRGLAVLLMLLAKVMVDSARVVDSQWRLVIVVWAYVMVVVGIWFTVSPWRMRDLIEWSTATVERTRNLSVARMGFGLFVAGLGMTAF